MKQRIKWQHGLPTECGIYLITVCEDKTFTDTSYYGCEGWEAYSADKIIAWASVDEIEPCTPPKFKWTARSDDGAFEDESEKTFSSKEECYNDMRNHALEKMKWNTEFFNDFDDLQDGEFIGYDVKFTKDKITHRSYSGLYVYEILED